MSMRLLMAVLAVTAALGLSGCKCCNWGNRDCGAPPCNKCQPGAPSVITPPPGAIQPGPGGGGPFSSPAGPFGGASAQGKI